MYLSEYGEQRRPRRCPISNDTLDALSPGELEAVEDGSQQAFVKRWCDRKSLPVSVGAVRDAGASLYRQLRCELGFEGGK